MEHRFIPREKLGKKARRALDREARRVWEFSPVTRKAGNKKVYDRRKLPRDRERYGAGFCLTLRACGGIIAENEPNRPEVCLCR